MTTQTAAATGTSTSPRRSTARRVVRGIGIALAGLLILLVLAFFLGGGWYFSGQVYADGLQVKHPGPSYGQEVVAVGDGTITIADPADEEPVLDGDAVYGLEWEGGYGQISGDGTGDDEVTRDFVVLSGERPHEGTVVSPDRPAFSDPDAALGRDVEDVTVDSDLGPLDAWYAPGSSDTWAVLVHGKGGERAEMLRTMRSTVDAGLPSLAISYRNDAGAPADPSGLYQFGRTEWHDLDAAVGYATDHGARRVVLVGASMAGGISASYRRHEPEAPLAGFVLDSPMLDFGETVSYGAEQEPLPLFGHVPAPLTWTAKQLTALRYGVDWAATDYLDDTAWLDVPALVIHGSDDTTVPLRTSQQLKASRPDQVTLTVVPGAEHVESWNVDPRAYDEAVTRFLRRL
jgi:pimeloyl-ACP methyl ester carboxylesterase